MTQFPKRTAASRVRELRMRRSLTVEQLAAELTKAGLPWDYETVVAFEDGRRTNLDVEELLALAVVLCVPPIALLTNPTIPTMAVAPEVTVPTAYGLLWLLGEQPLHGMTGAWVEETVAVRLVRHFYEQMCGANKAYSMLQLINRWAADGDLGSVDADKRRGVQERELTKQLAALSCTIVEMREYGVPVPRLVEQELLVVLARGRGITLDVSGPSDEAP